jgi:hypothetical protein
MYSGGTLSSFCCVARQLTSMFADEHARACESLMSQYAYCKHTHFKPTISREIAELLRTTTKRKIKCRKGLDLASNKQFHRLRSLILWPNLDVPL